MIIKVFVLVKGDDISCYHDLKQLSESNNLPYHTIRRRMVKNGYYKDNDMLIKSSVIKYHSEKGGKHEFRE